MKNFWLLVIVVLMNQTVMAEKYSRISISLKDKDINELSKLGLETDHGMYKPGYSFTNDFSESEIEVISKAGFTYSVIIDDVQKHYRDQNSLNRNNQPNQIQQSASCNQLPLVTTPSHFHLGSMGGYLTYDELMIELDSMVAAYPNLISVKQPISTTTSIEGNSIYYVTITDNPGVNESEPQMLYTSLHHAREPQGMQQLIFYMWYLLENYSTNTEVQYIVDNNEMFFVPCINPDGYMYNEATDPNGGGLWRKNRRDNMDGNFGVDLNRNYGYQWGYDNFGSSDQSGTETYRGTSAFSEPETFAMKEFCESHQFRLALNYHTYSNLLIYPYGYIPDFYTPDSAQFVHYGQFLTKENFFKFGTGNQTVNYVTNGSSDDWMYGEQTSKPKTFAMTPEVGEYAYGFWPPSFEIERLSAEQVSLNKKAALLNGKYAKIEETSNAILSSVNGYISFSLEQIGLDTTATYSVSLTPLTPNVVSTGAAVVVNTMNMLQVLNDSISYSLQNIFAGDVVQFLLSVDNGLYTYSDTITKYYGAPVIVYSSNGNTIADWTGLWNTTTEKFVSPANSITDSPFSLYADGDNNLLELNTPLDLSNASYAELNFSAQWEIEFQFDYVQVMAKPVGSSNYIALRGLYNHDGTTQQAFMEPVYDGLMYDWKQEHICLNQFLGQQINLAFVLRSDMGTTLDGFYFDDLQVRKVVPSGVGLNESLNGYAVSVFPNPANDKLFVSGLNSGKNYQADIFDVAGKNVLSISNDDLTGSQSINIQPLATGSYSIRISEKGNQNFIPVVKLFVKS